MNTLIEKGMMHVRIAQLSDELSGAYKVIDSLRSELERVRNEQDSNAETQRQEHAREMEALKEKHHLEMEECKSSAKAELSRVNEDHNNLKSATTRLI